MEKSCSIKYGLCQQQLTLFTQANATGTESTITLHLNIDKNQKLMLFCYVITASNSTSSVVVEGRLSDSTSK